MTLARLQVEKGIWQPSTPWRGRPLRQIPPDYAGFHGHILGRLGQSRAAVERYELCDALGAGEGAGGSGLGQALEGRWPIAGGAGRLSPCFGHRHPQWRAGSAGGKPPALISGALEGNGREALDQERQQGPGAPVPASGLKTFAAYSG